MNLFTHKISEELSLNIRSVEAVLSLLDEDEVKERAKAASTAAEGKKAGSAAAGTGAGTSGNGG